MNLCGKETPRLERIYELTARMKRMEAIVAKLAAKEIYNENE